MEGLLPQGEYGSALLDIDAAELDPTTVEAVGCELARALGSETGYAFWSPWASANSEFGPERVYARWPDMVERAEQVEPVVERLARERGWLPLAEQDRSGIAETMRREAEAGVYASASRPTPPEYEGPPLDYYDGGQDFEVPGIVSCGASNPSPRPPALIDGILREGHTMLITARSKAGKTMLLLELCVAVGMGGEWLGRRCKRGRCLLVNPETDPANLENRIRDIAEAKGYDPADVEPQVDFWHLRGLPFDMARAEAVLAERVERGTYALVCVDSVYEMYSGDENSAQDAREFFHVIDRLSRELGCAVAMTHHHAKGARSHLDALDRGSGSGVFGRKPDAPIDLTEVFPPSDEEALQGVTVFRVSDSGLREFPGIEPFNVIFRFPVHVIDSEGVTSAWKPRSPQQDGGRITGEGNKGRSKQRAASAILALCSEYILEGFPVDGLSASEAAAMVSARLGEHVSTQTLKRYVQESEVFDVEQTSKQRWRVVASDLN